LSVLHTVLSPTPIVKVELFATPYKPLTAIATHMLFSCYPVCYSSNCQVSDKMDPAELVSLIASLNPDNTPGRLAVIVRMGAEKLRAKFPALIEAVEQAGQVGSCFLCSLTACTQLLQALNCSFDEQSCQRRLLKLRRRVPASRQVQLL
jgi:hypothetical protein